MRDKLLKIGIHDPRRVVAGPLVTDWLAGGRTRHALLRVEDDAWVLKSYHRGGALGFLNGTRYWGRQRFLQELSIAAVARAAGVATPELLALVLEPAGYGSLRAWMVSRYLGDVRPLSDFFGHPSEADLFVAAGELVARMHRARIDHPDLHLGNIVARFAGARPLVYIIDWDRAVQRHAAWNPNANLVRLWRSVEKGRKLGRIDTVNTTGAASAPAALKAFVRGYFRGRRARDLEASRRYFRRRALALNLRGLFWRSDVRVDG